MTVTEALEKLKSYEQTSFALSHAMGLLYYDGVTAAPKGAAAVRSDTTGELSRIDYQLTTAPDTVEMLETLMAARTELDAVTRRKVEEYWRSYDRTRRIPEEEFVAYQKLTTRADDVWQTAKTNNDFALFEPYLQEIFDTLKRFAQYWEPEKAPYETLLDNYERGLTVAACDQFFAALRQKLVPLIQRVTAHADRVDDTPLHADFPIPIQREFSDFVMGVMGIDRNHCIIGETEHPFTINFSRDDVRITTNYQEDLVASSLYSVVHEGGHALYELHVGRELSRTCLGGGVSMAIHESQSRFYENIIGRSRAFCGVIYPWLREHFAPRLDDVSQDAFYRMINKAQPSLIRTEADELTYCLHIMVRYELEKALMQGTLAVADLPAAWNAKYKEYLGVDVPDDTHGCLQDIHWAMGDMGYFPSYALGSAYSAQAVDDLRKTMDLDAQWAEGNMQPLKDALRSRVWQHGRAKEPQWLVQSLCGGAFDAAHYTNYLKNKYTELYGL